MRSDNQKGYNFCTNCAAPLQITGRKCAAIRDAGEPFCGQCATRTRIPLAPLFGQIIGEHLMARRGVRRLMVSLHEASLNLNSE